MTAPNFKINPTGTVSGALEDRVYQWIEKNPEMIEIGLRILHTPRDRWTIPGTKYRPDYLMQDAKDRLVWVEVKRGWLTIKDLQQILAYEIHRRERFPQDRLLLICANLDESRASVLRCLKVKVRTYRERTDSERLEYCGDTEPAFPPGEI